mmetsp:Transcript_16529/g.49288  ORF Transcript_16529/g.49288 Transcript_16529/m.49288 type:complete len:92 (-) Transcript_16529:159-434(-)
MPCALFTLEPYRLCNSYLPMQRATLRHGQTDKAASPLEAHGRSVRRRAAHGDTAKRTTAACHCCACMDAVRVHCCASMDAVRIHCCASMDA